jgi:glutaredoxin
MKIIYYKSLVCPRCIPTNRLIARVRREHPEIEIEEIEVLSHLPRAWRDGVMTLPTLIVGAKRFHHAPSLEELLQAFEATSTT